MAAPQAFGVDDAEPALLAHLDDKLGRGERIGGVRNEGGIEGIGIDIPGGIHVLGRARAALGDDGDLV